MSRTFGFVRHAGAHPQTILDCLAQLPSEKSLEGKKVKIIASKDKDVDPTVRALEDRLKTVAVRTPHLGRGAENIDKIIRLSDEYSADVTFFVLHSEHAMKLPNAFGRHYAIANTPPLKEQKPGWSVVLKIPHSKLRAAENRTLLALESA